MIAYNSIFSFHTNPFYIFKFEHFLTPLKGGRIFYRKPYLFALTVMVFVQVQLQTISAFFCFEA
jgi:hypothetical protein